MGGFLEDTGEKRERELNALSNGEQFAMEMRGDFFAEKEVQTRRNVPFSDDEDKQLEEQKDLTAEMIEMQQIKYATQQIFEEAQKKEEEAEAQIRAEIQSENEEVEEQIIPKEIYRDEFY